MLCFPSVPERDVPSLQVLWEAWNKHTRFQELSLRAARLWPPGGQGWLVLWCLRPVCSLCLKFILCLCWANSCPTCRSSQSFVTGATHLIPRPGAPLLCSHITSPVVLTFWLYSLFTHLSPPLDYDLLGRDCLLCIMGLQSIPPSLVHRDMQWVGVECVNDCMNEWMTKMWLNTSVCWGTEPQYMFL